MTSPESQERHGLLNAGFELQPRRSHGQGYMALREILRDAGQGDWPADLDANLGSVLADLDGVASDLYRRARGRDVAALQIFIHSEQAPNPDSRVTLVSDRDQCGMPKLRVDWRLTPGDKRSIVQSTRSR